MSAELGSWNSVPVSRTALIYTSYRSLCLRDFIHQDLHFLCPDFCRRNLGIEILTVDGDDNLQDSIDTLVGFRGSPRHSRMRGCRICAALFERRDSIVNRLGILLEYVYRLCLHKPVQTQGFAMPPSLCQRENLSSGRCHSI